MAPASTTSRQSCSVTRQLRTWYITDPSMVCNCGSIGIFWGNRRGSIARMVNKTLLKALTETALSGNARNQFAAGFDFERRAGKIVSDRLVAAAKMFGEKRL